MLGEKRGEGVQKERSAERSAEGGQRREQKEGRGRAEGEQKEPTRMMERTIKRTPSLAPSVLVYAICPLTTERDHTNGKAPDPIRARKLSPFGSS